MAGYLLEPVGVLLVGEGEDYVRVPRVLADHLLTLAQNYGSRYAEELADIMYPETSSKERGCHGGRTRIEWTDK